MRSKDFSDQFRKMIIRYKRIGYNLNAMRESACLAINPILVDNFAALFNFTPVDRAADSMMARPKAIQHWSFRLLVVHRGSSDDPLLLQISSGGVLQSRDLRLSRSTLYLLSCRLCFFIV